MNNDIKIGIYICHCGVNIAQTVRVEEIAEKMRDKPYVEVSTSYKFMCSDPGQQMIEKDIREKGLNRIIVAACSPQMHELTFRNTCERAGLNRYLFQMANIREQCSWVHDDVEKATTKALALINAAYKRVKNHTPLEVSKSKINPDTLIIGGGIAGIQAALEIAESGNKVYLVEKESTIGGQMAKFDKTFPTLDCAACILTPKMVSVSHRKNIELMTLSEVEKVSGYIGNFSVRIRKKARYVTSKCTSCGECTKVCPVKVPNWFDEFKQMRTAIHKAFPQAVPNTYVIDRQERPPCIEACPIRQEAAGYIALIRNRKFHEAAQLIHKRNPLAFICGRICYHPCESECNRGHVDKPIAIQHLKRFALDWELKNYGKFVPPKIENQRNEKVAIVGSGPAGLVCAHDLAMKGFQVTVFEQYSIPGGMLAIGIPEYRLPKQFLALEINYLKDLGIQFRTNVKIGTDITIDDLFAEGYSAIFLAIGAHKSVKLDIPGEDAEGVLHGIDFLRKVNVGIGVDIGKNVAVIGGGNTAIDVARTALRLGARRVTILYRRSKYEMPASEEEIADAEAEGIHISYLTAPVEIIHENGNVKAVKCIRMTLGEPDSSGRRRPIPVPQSEHILEFDKVIVAISQMPDLSPINTGTRFLTTKWGTLQVNLETLETNIKGIFAGGDVVLGPSTVIASMGHGRRAAESIEKYLNGEPLENYKTHMVKLDVLRGESFRPHTYAPTYKETPKIEREVISKLDPVYRKTNFEEVELGFTEEQAVREASRCLNCGVCVECHECQRVCQPNAIDYTMKDEIVEIKVGQIIVATGYEIIDASKLFPYGYGRLENVYSSLEFERILSSTGPTGGKVVLRNGKSPRAVAIIHCVGSRDSNFNKYCSRVCCMYALKFAHLVKERTNAEVYQFYIDMRAYGKGYEEFYSRILNEGINVIRGKVAEVVERKSLDGEKFLVVKCEDTLIGKFREIPVDMVILCNALQPNRSAEKIAKVLGLSRSPDGFFLERHPKLDPFSTMSDGIYIVGCAQGPKDIPDTVAQASAAAGRTLSLISKGEVEIEPIRAYIDEKYCSGCRICNNLCPFNAIEFNEDKKISFVNEALCKGCGTCVAACPAGAITGMGFSDDQIYAELEGILEI
ncbi:FAD-dependent oxidoreductase [Rosettibacter firmus]|uniref:FAD-dependent oxidoreductase n=1 Tax=Rosettibacter firmus TaxID=3111522 RepID=UPI00336BE58D